MPYCSHEGHIKQTLAAYSVDRSKRSTGYLVATINRSKLYPLSVECAFVEGWPGFAALAASDRANFILLIITAYRRRRYDHCVYDGAMTLYCRVRDELFGRGRFFELNATLKLFAVNPEYAIGAYTMGYSLTPGAALVMESIPMKGNESWQDTDGHVLKTPARLAIQQRDIRGNHRRGTGNIGAVVDLNLSELLALQDEARQWKWHFKDGLPPPSGGRLAARLAAMSSDEARVMWLHFHALVPLDLILRAADTAVMKRGQAEITYIEHESGRLYTDGGFVQCAIRETRAAAFRGCFDYDVSNCHYSLLSQLARRCGHETPAIDDYLLRKSAIRDQLAADLGVSVKAIKSCLIALIYGASRRVNVYFKGNKETRPAILRYMGSPEKARALFDHRLFAALLADIRRVRKPVIDSMPRNRGRLINPFGKGIDSKESEELLAHILQGAEAAILHVVIRLAGESICLLMHDGWVSREPLNIPQIVDAIRAETGFDVEIEQAIL